MEAPQRGPGVEPWWRSGGPRWGLGATPPEADGIVLNEDTQFLYVDINTNRAVLFPAELKFLRFKIFLQHQWSKF